MIDLKYSRLIEATQEPGFFSVYSPDLEGFTGIGHSVEDCICKAKWGMLEHFRVFEEQRLPVPVAAGGPRITIVNTPSLQESR